MSSSCSASQTRSGSTRTSSFESSSTSQKDKGYQIGTPGKACLGLRVLARTHAHSLARFPAPT
jgi:hypothetical protein